MRFRSFGEARRPAFVGASATARRWRKFYELPTVADSRCFPLLTLFPLFGTIIIWYEEPFRLPPISVDQLS